MSLPGHCVSQTGAHRGGGSQYQIRCAAAVTADRLSLIPCLRWFDAR